jgi:Thioredoxin-like
MKKTILLLMTVSITIATCQAQERTNPANQSEELGTVSWYREYNTALTLSKKEGKPVLILFQEVPGCMTCRNYGHHVLSHPLLVDAIEQLFIPLAIYNNKKGKDAAVLQRYGEPAWNNPVVRIVDEHGENLVDRVSGNYSRKGLYQAMEAALIKSGKEIPAFMLLLKQEIGALEDGTEMATFQMYCFWSGESHIGKAEGVVATEAGFMNGAEVVKVTYNPDVISSDELESFAQKAKCTKVNSNGIFRKDKDPQYYLKQSDYKYLPLSPIQKTKINSALKEGKDASVFLSPTQLKWLGNLNKYNAAKVFFYEEDFAVAWKKMVSGERA